MAIKINTLEMLLEELDQDLQWRKKRNIRYKDPYNSKRLFAMFVTLLFYIIMCTFRRIYQICLKCIHSIYCWTKNRMSQIEIRDSGHSD